MRSILRFDSVRFEYRTTPVLSGFDLRIEPGEMTAVLGPNGSGKTTLVRLSVGRLRCSAGRVLLEGRDVCSMPARERARIVAVVPQETHLAFDFTVRQVVLMGRAPHLGLMGIETEADREIAREAMEQTEVDHLAERSFQALSGGERQRVIVARALVQRPRLLLLDEPTAFLDLKHRLAVYRLLEGLNRKGGITVVVVSHDINLAARNCDRLILLHRGSVTAEGSPDRVLTAENLAAVYETRVEIRHDPVTSRPYVYPLRPLD